MTAARCAWWTGLVMVTAWCWAIGAPWWLAAPTVILVAGRTVAALRALGATWRRAIANAADYEDARLSARMLGYEGDDLDDLMWRASVERRLAARPMAWKKTVMALIREDWGADW